MSAARNTSFLSSLSAVLPVFPFSPAVSAQADGSFSSGADGQWPARVAYAITAGSPALRRFAAWLALLVDLRRERRALAGLDDHQLRDIAIDRARARVESERGWFDVPASRRLPQTGARGWQIR